MVGEVTGGEDDVHGAAAQVTHHPPGALQGAFAPVEVGVTDVRHDQHADMMGRANRRR